MEVLQGIEGSTGLVLNGWNLNVDCLLKKYKKLESRPISIIDVEIL